MVNKLLELPEDVVTLALQRHILVLDLAAQRYRPPADLVGHTHGSTSAGAWPCTHKDTIC